MSQPERFAALLSELAREVTRRRTTDVCCGDLTLEQFETLRVVARAGTPTIGALSAALDVDLSTMSRNVSVLERNGYLRRVKSVADGRRVHVQLTQKGGDALTTLQCDERDILGRLYKRIPARQRAAVLETLGSVRGWLLDGRALALPGGDRADEVRGPARRRVRLEVSQGDDAIACCPPATATAPAPARARRTAS